MQRSIHYIAESYFISIILFRLLTDRKMTNYFCHKCRNRCVGLERIEGEVRCNRCHAGFIEEITGRDNADAQPGTARIVLDGPNADPFGGFPGSPFSRLFSNILRHNGGNPSQRAGSSSGQNVASNEQRAASQPPNNAQEDQQQQDPMSNFLNQLLGQLVANTHTENTGGQARLVIQFGGIPGGSQEGGGFNIGNLQDYAWGEHGLDDVLTALLNQFDQAQEQSRALRPEDIKKLPITRVTQDKVDNGTQCTTCMETFRLDEEVAKLECDHIFHPDCLKPWLKRNNTCPICRKVIDPKKWGPTITDIDELD